MFPHDHAPKSDLLDFLPGMLPPQRITAHSDTDADGNIDGDDPVTHFAYDSRWRIVARFEDTNSDPMGPSFPVGETWHALHANGRRVIPPAKRRRDAVAALGAT